MSEPAAKPGAGVLDSTSDMRSEALYRWGVLLLLVLVGLTASSLLLVDYLRPVPIFCGYDGGCGQVSRSEYASIFGLKTPVIGVAGYVVLGVLTILRGRYARVGLLVASAIGAAVAAFLLSAQVRMGVFCPYCVVVDVSSILVFVLAAWRMRSGWDPPGRSRVRAAGGLSVTLAFGVPLGVGLFVDPPLPKPVKAEMARTPKGVITVVDFVDFECPFCRETQAEFEPVLEAHKSQVRLVRKQVPLRMHPHANDAARAACCGEEMGKGDALAGMLFTTPEDELTPDGCAKMAEKLGLDVDRFRACMKDPRTEAHIKSDIEDFRASGGHGLPTIFVGKHRQNGGQDRRDLEQAVSQALADLSG
jgi:uncharacterized membrane protein/predicted DsbA family dithiol-disulfide isomerase